MNLLEKCLIKDIDGRTFKECTENQKVDLGKCYDSASKYTTRVTYKQLRKDPFYMEIADKRWDKKELKQFYDKVWIERQKIAKEEKALMYNHD